MQGTFRLCALLRVEIRMHKDGTLQYDLINLHESFRIFLNLFGLHSVPLACMQLRVRVEIGMHKDGTLQYDLISLYESFQIFSNPFGLHSVLLACMQFH